MATIRILTYNVQFGKRIDRIIDWVNRLPEEDILCFQEFPKDKIEESVRVLGRTPYGYRFAPSIVRKKRIFGELTLFRKSEFTLISSRIISLGVHRIEKTVLRSPISRSCLFLKLRYGARTFTITNVHLTSVAANRYKYRQAERIATLVHGYRVPSIVVGDFNLLRAPGRRHLFAIMERYGFTGDTTKLVTYQVSLFRNQFDYVFVKNCVISRLHAVKMKLSDHYPMFVSCRIAPKSSSS